MRASMASMHVFQRLGFCLACLAVLLGLLPASTQAQHAVEQINDPEIQYKHALGLLRRQFYDLSEPQFRLFLEKFPGHALSANASYHLIQCLRFQNKTAEMLTAIRRFREQWPQHDEMTMLTLLEADTLFGAGDYAAAAACYQQLTQVGDQQRQEQAKYFLAQCHAQTGRAEEAMALHRELDALPLQDDRPYRFYAKFELAWIHQRQNHFDKAEAGFARLADHAATPETLLADTLYHLGDVRLRLKQYDQALAAFDRYVVQFPDGIHGSAARKCRITIHANAGNHDRCLELLQDWREKYPSESDCEMDFLHGYCLMKKEQVEEAIPFFVRVGADPAVPTMTRRNARLLAIRCQLLAKQHAAALASIEGFLADYPKASEKGDVFICQGEAADASGKPDEAEQAFRAAMVFFNDDLENYQQAADRLVDVMAKRMKWAEGAAILRQMSTRPGLPNRANYRLRAGEFEIQAGNLAAAQADLQLVIDEFGADAAAVRAARSHLLRIAVQNSNFAVAQKHAEDLMQDCPPDEYGTLAYSLAVFHYNQGNLDKALATLSQAMTHPGLTPVQARNLQTFYGRVLLESGDSQQARKIVAQLLTYPEAEMRDVLTPSFLFKAGDLCEQENDWNQAEAIWRRLASYEHEPIWSYRSKIRLAQVHILKGQLEEAENLLANLAESLNDNQDQTTAPRQELFSLLAETQLLRKRTSQALVTASKALTFTDGDERSLARTRWVLAKILFEDENNPSEALSYAMKCYVLANDPVYTPRGILLTIRIFLAQNRQRDALSAWRELEALYPAWAGQERGSDDIKAMLEAASQEKEAPAQP
ncbi:MAG TPA: tetratricopeptide repeat protein [Lentisphaeria bacterium]|nr:tetratricopeptide repeat protein [Lentisphaerota bacterium]HPY89462.1 tetratricopeptide repeat protein [Lentisphaeria bacterium]HQC52125.1 tetratricopeptide repeat protein [Lentisphaeria bacterium]HQL88265.1 tetratricopeptide repeat protein [Lentisphaeria bacterium]